jgi:hypothetical protein
MADKPVKRVRLQHVPVSWPNVWEIRALDGEYLASFRSETSAKAYMRLMNMAPVGDK